VPRRRTAPGVDPLDTVTYELRDSTIGNPDGSVVFAMRGAEVPASWSQLATDILVSKYFRRAGIHGDPTKGETSVREVVFRIARTLREEGEARGYFTDRESAEAFEAELSDYLVHQYGAFNSPVWFNVGLFQRYGIRGSGGQFAYCFERDEVIETTNAYERPQASACFIQSVQDDLMSIFDLLKSEARLFKYGSGTGSNFSALRGKQEKLSGGGTSSGLMSFLEVFDRAAGSTKSGGTTRRAAKMVCLDMDHPEIVDFIEWKMREEKKAQALIAAGYPSDFNGEAYHTVSGQNSNNSVRVTDEFMQAVEHDGEWSTRARTTGEVVETFKARDLWRKIAESAWRCADPGVQYDTTINDWHTCPNTARINASNPCVTGDTLVATSQGLRRIDSLLASPTEVVGADGELHPIAPAFSTGTKPVYRLTTKSGIELELTADHRVLTKNRGDVPACELTRDDVLVLGRPAFGSESIDARVGEFLGLMLGDGCLSNSNGQTKATLTFGTAEEALAQAIDARLYAFCRSAAEDGRESRDTEVHRVEWDDGRSQLRMNTSSRPVIEILQKYAVLDRGNDKKLLTDAAFGLDRASLAAILRGLFTADGTVANYGEKSQYVALDATSLPLLRQVQQILLGFGVRAKIYRDRRVVGQTTALLPDGKGGRKEYPVQQIHSLRIGKASRVVFQESIGFIAESDKSAALAKLNREVAAYTEPMTDKVESLVFIGERPVFDLTEPVTHHFVANGITVHNCSEYMFLDDSACNLASLNLTKFLVEKADGTLGFDVEGYRHAARVFFIAQEILVDFSSYPTRAIAQNSHDYRPLGLGYANLGTLLMLMGLPYDSDEGRAVAAALTAILTGHAYRTSAELAARKGPFVGYAKNRESMLRVMRKHRDAAYAIDASRCPPELLRAAREDWDQAVELGEKFGYRNAQATVLAPTGTIGLLMDCDTTGIEPDFSLVKYKKLAGGGYFKIVNASVERALLRLGYSAGQVSEILAYVIGTNTFVGAPHVSRAFLRSKGLTDAEVEKVEAGLRGVYSLAQAFGKHVLGADVYARLGVSDEQSKQPGFSLLEFFGLSREQIEEASDVILGRATIEGAPHLREEHYPVFDCANRCGRHGKRFLAPMAHLKMMAAVQPFLSGAISKCVTGDTMVATERGLLPIGSLYRGEAPDTFRKDPMRVASEQGTREAVEFYYGGERPVLRLQLGDGRTLTGTPNHRVKVASASGYDWKRLDEIAPGDHVAIRLGAEVWAKGDASLVGFAPSPSHGSQKAVRFPEAMNPELGLFLGYYIAEGNKTHSNWTVRITNNDEGVLARANEIVARHFGIEGCVVVDARNGVKSLVIASKMLCEWLDHVGARGLPPDKEIPWAVLQSTRETVLAFVRGLWLDGYVSVANREIAICLASRKLVEQLQVVLDNLGLRSTLGRRFNKEYQRDYFTLYLTGPAFREFVRLVPLDEKHKREAAEQLAREDHVTESVWSDGVPCFREEMQAAIRSADATQAWRNVMDARTRSISWETARQVFETFGVEELRPIVQNNIHFVMVRSIEDGYEEVFDLYVPDSNAFLGNSVVNHNTVNMPNDATVDDIAEIYMQGWKLGLKAVALYRDGCKSSQPLSARADDGATREKDKPAKATEQPATVHIATMNPTPSVQVQPAVLTGSEAAREFGPLFAKAPTLGPQRASVRYRLPKKRRGFTQEARIAGHKVFLRTGEYEDGQLGEIFIDMHKEGAAFRSLMNCFAIAVSMGLQHGVSLAEYVDTFTFTRFEPQGPVEGHPNIKFATSIVDYVFRVLAVEYLQRYDLAHVRPDETARAPVPVPTLGSHPTPPQGMAVAAMELDERGPSALDRQLSRMMGDAPFCDTCGHITVRNGACYRCLNCGNSMGCS
jgi:ribonucleoside-diphosphate reductase alpha chain